MKVVALVQARMGSTRLPGKVMRTILDKPMIELLLGRLARARTVDQIGVATSASPANEPLAALVRSLGYVVYQGSENDVLDRYYQAAVLLQAEAVVRITGDCPLVDPALVDEVVAKFRAGGLDYLSNVDPPTFPDGLDIEVFSFDALRRAHEQAGLPAQREHVTPYIRESGLFRKANVAQSDADDSSERWTVDEPKDLEVVRRVFEHFTPRLDFGWQDVKRLRSSHPAFDGGFALGAPGGSVLELAWTNGPHRAALIVDLGPVTPSYRIEVT